MTTKCYSNPLKLSSQRHFTRTINSLIGGYYRSARVRTSRCSFCQGQDQVWTGNGGRTRHLQADTKWSPSWLRVKRPREEERMLQAPLGPRPSSIFGSERHGPEPLALKSQLPLWSVSALRMESLSFRKERSNSAEMAGKVSFYFFEVWRPKNFPDSTNSNGGIM